VADILRYGTASVNEVKVSFCINMISASFSKTITGAPTSEIN